MPRVAAIAHLAAGAVLVLAAWLLPRRVAGSRIALSPALVLDAAPWLLGGLLPTLATGRPIFGGLIILALAAGFALADQTMRESLREPVVFCAMSELPQVFTHPHLYLPFAGPKLVIGGAAAALAGATALFVLEPPSFPPAPLLALWMTAAVMAAIALTSCEPLLGFAARLMRGLRPTGEPEIDAALFGPFGMLLVHGIIARAEREGRQRAFAAPAIVGGRGAGPARPVVIVQCESFFDACRVSPLVPADLLPGFEGCRREAQSFGRLEVPGWGANTMRSEFAVLTGICDGDLGYDRFNPYHAFARVPIASQVWRMRREGYRTICLHPFDRRFFRRDLVLPALGFELFLGRESLGGSRVPPYFPDPDLAFEVLRVLEEEGPKSFIFVITMDNHGPWLRPAPKRASGLDPAALPQGEEFLSYLEGLRRSDQMLQILREGFLKRGLEGVLSFYGDHLPSLPQAFRHFGFAEPHSDYVIWPSRNGAPQRIDLPAYRLGAMVVDAALGKEGGRVEGVGLPRGAAAAPILAPVGALGEVRTGLYRGDESR
jgi:Sulfatase